LAVATARPPKNFEGLRRRKGDQTVERLLSNFFLQLI
jgi:hypothetical protein